MAEEQRMYQLIDEVLKNDYVDAELFAKSQERLAQNLLTCPAVHRNAAKDYILTLMETAAIDDVDGDLYVKYINAIRAGRRPTQPQLKNAQKRLTSWNLETIKNSDSLFSSGLTGLSEFMTQRSGPSTLALLAKGERTSDPTSSSLLESIAATTKFQRILTALALRSENSAFAAITKPQKRVNEAHLFIKALQRRQKAIFIAVFKQLKQTNSVLKYKASILVQTLKAIMTKNNIANKAFGFNILARERALYSRDFSVLDTLTPVSFRGMTPIHFRAPITPVNFKITADIFEREKRRQQACLAMIFNCKLTVEQLSLWRWVIHVRETRTRLKNIQSGERKIRGIAKRSRKFAALTLWNSLLPLPSRFNSMIVSPDRTLQSEMSTFRSNAYRVYLTRLNKLNILSTFVMTVRCSVEQIALWKWKLAITGQRRRKIIRILKLCAKSAVKLRGQGAFHHWKLMTTKGTKILPPLIKKSILRWYYVKKSAFTMFSMASGHEAKPLIFRSSSTMWESLIRLG